MNFRRFLGLAVVLACLVSQAGPSLAQTEPRGVYATVYGQASWLGSTSFNEVGNAGFGSGLEASFNTGFGFGANAPPSPCGHSAPGSGTATRSTRALWEHGRANDSVLSDRMRAGFPTSHQEEEGRATEASKDQGKVSRSKMRAAGQHCLQPAW
jgi:hypothetical protein